MDGRDAIASVTVFQLKNDSLYNGNAISIGGKLYRMICLVGLVKRVIRAGKHLIYTLDDRSGSTINGKQAVEKRIDETRNAMRKYVEVVGYIGSADSTVEIQILHVRVVDNGNSISAHLLSASKLSSAVHPGTMKRAFKLGKIGDRGQTGVGRAGHRKLTFVTP